MVVSKGSSATSLVFVCFIAISFFGAPRPADAQATPASSRDDAAARREFGAGREAYDHGDFRKALAHFERAYELSGHPELLFNIGRAADSDGQASRAIAAYTAYLEALPGAENRDFVRSRLERVRASQNTSEPEAAKTAVEDADPRYRELVDEALSEYDAGNYEEARSLFARAHGVFPNARTLRGLGKAEFELRNYEASIAQLEAALNEKVRPLDDKLRLDTERLLSRARNFVSELTIETKPTASALLVDGSPMSNALGKPVLLGVGDHVIEAQAPGYVSEKRRISVKGGETQRLNIVLSPASSQLSESRTSRRWYTSPWLWTAAGAIVAGGVTAGVLATRPNERPRAQTDTYWVMP